MNSSLSVLLGASCAVALLWTGTAPAHAEGSEVHCATEVTPIGDPAPSTKPACFDTPEEVDAYLGGDARAAFGTLGSVVLGTVYKDVNYGGSSLTYWGASGCSGVTYGYPTVAAEWSSGISSVRASNSCWVTVYASVSYGGTKLTCSPDCSGLGSLNDAVRSIVFRPVGTWG